MTEAISLIVLGLALMLMAFIAKGVSDDGFSDPRTEPLPKGHRRTLLGFGILLAAAGVLRLLKF